MQCLDSTNNYDCFNSYKHPFKKILEVTLTVKMLDSSKYVADAIIN